MTELTPDTAFAIALGSGYLAAILYALWPVGHKCKHGKSCPHNVYK